MDDNKGIIKESGNYADNVRYYYDGTKFTSENGIYCPEDGSKVFYHAVYPYCPNASNSFTFDVETDQYTSNGYTLSDLCTASTSATDATLVPLKFNHRLTKLTIDLQGDNWPSGEMELRINNVYTSIQIDLNNLTFTPTGNRQNIECATNGTRSFKVILPPQQIEGGTDFATLTIGGTPYNITITDDTDLDSGVQFDMKINMNENYEIVEFTGDINLWNEPDDRLDNVVPEDIQDDIEEHMPIYRGVNPPNVEGGYFMDEVETVYCEDYGNGGYAPGHIVNSMYIRFLNQNMTNNTVDFMESNENGTSVSEGNGAFISGSGNNFTAFFNTIGETDGISTRTALVISGTKSTSGIQNLYYAFVMVEKGEDPNNHLMKEGVFRIFKDSDGLAVNYDWSAHTKFVPSDAGHKFGLFDNCR